MPRALALRVLALLAAAHAACAAGGRHEPPPEPQLASVGAGYFRESCASCHGLDGRGHGPAASALTPPPADLTRIALRRAGRFPSAEVAQFIDGRFELPAHGSRAMPIWGTELLPPGIEPGTAEEIARGRILSLVEYLRTIQVREP